MNKLKFKKFESIRKCTACKIDKPLRLFRLNYYKCLNTHNSVCIKCEDYRCKLYKTKTGGDAKKDVRTCKTCGEVHKVFNFKYYNNKDLFGYNCRKCYYSNQANYDKGYYKKNKSVIKKKNVQTQKAFRARKNGTVDAAYLAMRNVARLENVKCLITKEELFDRLTNQKVCEFSGKPLIFSKYRYSLDRKGLKRYGGNGKKGGDYRWENVRIVLFQYNKAREVLQLTHNQMIRLLKDMRKNPGRYK